MERRKFTREFKLEAGVRLIKEDGVSYAQASQDLNCCASVAVAQLAEGACG